MAEGGVDSVILGAAVGDYGLVHSAASIRRYAASSGVYPPYHVMDGLYAASGATRRATDVTAPREVQALAFEIASGIELWIASLVGETRQVLLEGVDISGARITSLDDASFAACMAGPEGFAGGEAVHGGGVLSLSPYAVARLRLAL
jgi:hypothetical protein